ncbi:MAG: hypothetical protein Q8L98_02705 [Chlamydiales bacterium]|nr:hypothetical protein [Chlamydiales bacterium]
MKVEFEKFVKTVTAVVASSCIVAARAGIVVGVVAPIMAIAAQIFQHQQLAQALLIASPIGFVVGVPALVTGVFLAFLLDRPIIPYC